MHVIKVNIPPGWKGRKYIESSGEMKIDLDVIAEWCGNPKYTYFPFPMTSCRQVMKMPMEDFRKICNLIIKYSREEDLKTAEEVFTKSDNEKVRVIWKDAKAKFTSKRRTKHSSQT